MDSFKRRVKLFFNKEEVESPSFLRNGSILLEKLISLSNGRDDHILIRTFTVKEITKMTNNFKEITDVQWFKGNLDGRPVLVKRGRYFYKAVIYDIAITASMSHLKNNIKLIGCCLHFDRPATVYEYIEGTMLSSYFDENYRIRDNTLSWSSRVKIAREIASMVVYLHTCFPLPIVHRDIKPSNVIIDGNGVAKLVDFTFAIQLPKGESKLDAQKVQQTFQFIAPEYMESGVVSTKIDVYSFGMLLLMILTGKTLARWDHNKDWFDEKEENIHTFVKQFNIDPKISNEIGVDEFKAIKDLVLMCTKENADDRPEMIDVARKLHQIEKVVRKYSRG